jgi:hypothetical protein
LIAISERARAAALALRGEKAPMVLRVDLVVMVRFRAYSWRLPISRFFLVESDADPSFLSPHHMAMLSYVTRQDMQGHLMRDSEGASYVKSCSRRRYVANCAIYSCAGELNCSGLKNPLA